MYKTFALCFLSLCMMLVANASHAQTADSTFIAGVKDYVFKEMNIVLDGTFYTHRDTSDQPLYYLYVSLKNKVEIPFGYNRKYATFNSKYDANIVATYRQNMGYATFLYLAYASSSTLLNKRLLSYRRESVTMIVFHELMHNYIEQFKLDIPYDFNEAAADILGNYGAKKYAADSHEINLKTVKKQLRLNENIYQCMNHCIAEISLHPDQTNTLTAACQQKIRKLLKHGDLFQHDRFDFDINTATLLKNSYYSKNYFLLKRVFLKQKSIAAFLDIIKSLPTNDADAVNYLERYL